jgi:phosphoserine phosphatase RsbU/P
LGEVGGDFYDLLELTNGHLGLVAGDATGKGVPAASVMTSARSMLHAVAQPSESPGVHPDHVHFIQEVASKISG